jgi:WD40 repeat protein
MLSPSHVQRLIAALHSRLPLLGGWLRQRARRLLLANADRHCVEEVAGALAECRDPRQQSLLRELLAQMPEPVVRETLARVWWTNRFPQLASLIRERGWLPEAPLAVRVGVALLLGRASELPPEHEIVVLLLGLRNDPDPGLAASARAWLESLPPGPAFDPLAAEWLQTRDPWLRTLLEQAGHLPAGPPRFRLHLALSLGWLDPVRPIGPDEVSPLLHLLEEPDPLLVERARELLGRLENPAARETVCRLGIEGNANALLIARKAGYRPTDPATRALFLFLAEQWREWRDLDQDGGLLRSIYLAAASDLRQRIVTVGQRAGRAELVEIVSGGRLEEQLDRRSDQEWDALAEVLHLAGDRSRLWQLTRLTSPGRSAAILTRIAGEDPGWAPPGQEDEYRTLTIRARDWTDEALGPTSFARATLLGHHSGIVSLAAGPGRAGGPAFLASVDEDGNLQWWSLRRGERLNFPGWPKQPTHGSEPLGGPITWVSFSPDGETFLAAGPQSIRLWRLADFSLRTLRGCTGPVSALTFTPDGRTLVSLTPDFAQVWDLTEIEPEGKPLQYEGRLLCQAISPDGEVLAVGCADGSVWLSWHLPHGELKDRLPGHSGPVREIAFSSDGRTLASAGSDGVRLWNVANQALLGVLPRQFIPLAGSDFTAATPGVTSWQSREQIPLWPDPLGELLVARAHGRHVRLLTPDSERVVQELPGHQAPVTCLTACPELELWASGDEEGTLRLWGFPSRLSYLTLEPVCRAHLSDWQRVRDRLAEPGISVEERGALLFLDALLHLRWRNEIHVEEAGPAPRLAGDISVEDG